MFNGAGDSNVTGTTGNTVLNYDTLVGFTPGVDHIQVNGTAYEAFTSVKGGQLSDATFNADLSAAIGTSLTGNAAVFFTASSGDHANQTFLVINTDGVDGYQAGSDLVVYTAPAMDVTPPANTIG